MSFRERRLQAKQERQFHAGDGTTFLLRPVTQNDYVLAATGHAPAVRPALFEMQALDESARLEKLAELYDQKGGLEALMALSRQDDWFLCLGIVSPRVLPDTATEAEIDAADGIWVSDFKRLYPEWPEILARINALSGVSAQNVEPDRFPEAPAAVSLSGEGVQPDTMGDSQ